MYEANHTPLQRASLFIGDFRAHLAALRRGVHRLASADHLTFHAREVVAGFGDDGIFFRNISRLC
ncbi:MAG: hypothetical protein IT381_25235 [Deltaproteobacteria bacterium]|nr:hypothetical protein [Deltaproteobacteria bacterium]